MKSFYDTNNVASKKQGVVEIEYDEVTGAFLSAVIHAIPDYGVLLTLDWPQTWGLLQVCEYVFEPSEIKEEHVPKDLWADTGFRFMAPLCDRPDMFWLSFGPLNCYVPTERMKTVYQDLKATLDLLGGTDRFIPEHQNQAPYR